MKFVIQRVIEAKCVVEQKIIGEIKKGYCVLIGISNNDTYEIADKMIKKMLNLRIFADENDKTNLSINDVNGNLLLISQFTLYANCKKGNRPSFIDAGLPEPSKAFYLDFIQAFRSLGFTVAEGEFGADMAVELVNDGPVTIIIDSKNR